MSIAIFPASGGLGGSTLSHLLETVKVDPSSLTLIARSPERLAKEEARGAKVLKADYDHPETLDGVFKGVEVLNLISYASFQHKYRFKVCHCQRNNVELELTSGRKSRYRLCDLTRSPSHNLLFPRIRSRWQTHLQTTRHARPPRYGGTPSFPGLAYVLIYRNPTRTLQREFPSLYCQLRYCKGCG
jgi:hypothetical protein